MSHDRLGAALAVLAAALTVSCATDKPSKPAGPPALTLEASASPDSGAVPLEVSFQAEAGGGVQPYAYLWGFGDGAVSATQNPTHTYQHVGAYDAVVTASDAADPPSARSDTLRVTATPRSELICEASAYPRSGVCPFLVNFDASVSGGIPPYHFAWSFGDGGTSTEQSPGTIYDDVGTYHASLTVQDSAEPPRSCEDEVTIFATDPFECDAEVDSTFGVAPFTVHFMSAASGGTAPYTYAWDFADGDTSTAANPTKTYETGGTFIATLTVHDSSDPEFSCSDTVSVAVLAPMECSVSGEPLLGPAPLSVDFQATVSGGLPPYFFLWSFGDGRTGFQQNITHQYASARTYDVALTVLDSEAPRRACQAATITVTVVPLLECAAAADPVEGLSPLDVAFSGTASGGTPPLAFHWTFGDGADSGSQNPTHTFPAAGVFQAIFTVSDAGPPVQSCSDTLAISVHAPLVCSTSADRLSGPAPLSVAFLSDVSGGDPPYSYSWDFGDGFISQFPSPIHVFTRPGIYHVAFLVEDAATPGQQCQGASLEITVTEGR